MISDNIERVYKDEMEFYRTVYKDSPRWNGRSSIAGKKIIVYCEQGYGDVIQFARYLKSLKALGCYVMLHCSGDLHNIFQYVEGIDGLIDKSIHQLPEHDYHVLSMSLPFVLDSEVIHPYIKFSDRYDLEEHKNNFNIGIAWEGNKEHSNNIERSCPLKHFKRLLDIPNVQLFSLQKEFSEFYIQDCEDIDLYSIEINNFTDTASLINALHLVISVDTSVLHLAGALNKRCIGLLSHRHDFRWNVYDWYPSMSKVIQEDHFDWDSVFEQLFPIVAEFSFWA